MWEGSFGGAGGWKEGGDRSCLAVRPSLGWLHPSRPLHRCKHASGAGRGTATTRSAASSMAGFIIFIAPPMVGSFVLSPVLQWAMRAAGASLMSRVAIELGMVAGGLYALHRGIRKPGGIPYVPGHAGNGFAGTNWWAFYSSTALVMTGVLTLGWGIVINGVLAIAREFS